MASPSAPGGAVAELLLSEFNPRSQLVLEETVVEAPRFPVVDAHLHLRPPFGGDWAAERLRGQVARGAAGLKI